MEEDYVMIPGSGTKKIIRDVKKEIETAFLDYSMSVIVSRALPDVRDGTYEKRSWCSPSGRVSEKKPYSLVVVPMPSVRSCLSTMIKETK